MSLAVVFLALVPADAWGVADVIKNSGNRFDRSTYYSDQGELVQFQHTGGAPHNVRSTQFSGGERLFSSDTISTGTTPVNGTQNLAPGTYSFICTIHPSQMSADLVVQETGTPPPAPGPGPGPAPAPGTPGTGSLDLDLEAKKQKLRKKLAFFATASADSTLVVSGKAIKKTTKELAADQKTKLKAKLKRKPRKRLAKKLDRKGKAKAKVKATATDQSGATATDTVKVKLKD